MAAGAVGVTAAYDAGMAANDFPDEDTRRFIVDATTGEAVPQPTEGFGSEDDAEAHLLDNQQMETVRMLTNHDMDSGAPFAAVLIGQPTLRQRLRLGVLAALDQRISVRYTLAGMNPTETADYITHHLKIAGRTDTLFSADAITLIHNASRGYPRAVNNLAVNALTAAFARNNPIIDEKATRTAISETGAD